MVWITGGIKFIQVTTDTGVWGIGVIAIMTGGTVVGNSGMGTVQGVNVVMVSKSGGRPTGSSGMACGTVGTEAQSLVIRIGRLIEIRRMTTRTGIRGVGVIAVMTGNAIIGYQGMPPR